MSEGIKRKPDTKEADTYRNEHVDDKDAYVRIVHHSMVGRVKSDMDSLGYDHTQTLDAPRVVNGAQQVGEQPMTGQVTLIFHPRKKGERQ